MATFVLAAAAAAAALFEHYGPNILAGLHVHNITLQLQSSAAALGLYEVRLAGVPSSGQQLLSCSVAGRYRVFAPTHVALTLGATTADRCEALEKASIKWKNTVNGTIKQKDEDGFNDDIDWRSALSQLGNGPAMRAVVFDGLHQTFELLSYPSDSSSTEDEPFSFGLSHTTGSLLVSDGRLPNGIDTYLSSTVNIAKTEAIAMAAGQLSSVVLDARLFAPFNNTTTTTSSSTKDLCRGFRRAAEGALLLSSGLQRSRKSLLYWHSRCALTAPVVSMYEATYAPQLMHSTLPRDAVDEVLYPSIADTAGCRVYRIDGEPEPEYHHSSSNISHDIHCLDDLFTSEKMLTVVGAMGLSGALGGDGGNSRLVDYRSLERVPLLDEFLDVYAAVAAHSRQAAAARRAGRPPPSLRITSHLTAAAGDTGRSSSSGGGPGRDPRSLREQLPVHPQSQAEFSSDGEGVNVCHGISFVLVFVLREQVAAAREVAQIWRTGCVYRETCMMHNRIFIFESLPEMIGGGAATSAEALGGCSHVLQQRPSIRSSLLTALDVVNGYASGKDVVTILIGMATMLSFPQIGMHGREDRNAPGLVPAVAMGDFAFYRLRSRVSVASSPGGEWGVHGLSAHGTSLALLLDSVFARERELYGGDDSGDDEGNGEARLVSLLQEYFEANPSIVRLDANHSIFDHRLAANAFVGAAAAADGHCRLQRYSRAAAGQEHAHPHLNLGLNSHVVDIIQRLFPLAADSSYRVADMRAVLAPRGPLQMFAMKSILAVDASWSTLASVLDHAYRAGYAVLRRDNALLPTGVPELYVQLLSRAAMLVGLSALHSRVVTHLVLLREYNSASLTLQALLASALDGRAQRGAGGGASGGGNNSSTVDVDALEEVLVESMHNSLSAFLAHSGPFELAASALARSLSVASYDQVRLRRAQWREQRKTIGAAKLHVLTASNKESREVGLLRRSAVLAGVDLTVVGLGRTYDTFYDKLVWYCDYLRSASNGVKDDDVLMLVDAFDVLLFPSTILAPQVLARSATPVLTCAEYGIHPDLIGGSFYRRGRSFGQRQRSNKRFYQVFLNSGCVVGRARQIKDLMFYALRAGLLNQDDQLVFTRYLYSNPDLMDIDIDNELFITGYSLQKDSGVQLLVESTLDLTLVDAGMATLASHLGVLHCNNAKSNTLYDNVAQQMLHWDAALQGPDGPLILQAVHLLWQDKRDAMAGAGTCGFHDVGDAASFYYNGGVIVPREGAAAVHGGQVGPALLRSWELLSSPAIASNMSGLAEGGLNHMSPRLAAFVGRLIGYCNDVRIAAEAVAEKL